MCAREISIAKKKKSMECKTIIGSSVYTEDCDSVVWNVHALKNL